jgi:hypothetical protein
MGYSSEASMKFGRNSTTEKSGALIMASATPADDACVAKIFMWPCGCSISGAHLAALGTRLALHDHWPLAWHETESQCRVPDDNVFGGTSSQLNTHNTNGSCWIPGSWICRGRLTSLLSPFPPRSPYFSMPLKRHCTSRATLEPKTTESNNQWCESLTYYITILVSYKLNSAIERGTKSDA